MSSLHPEPRTKLDEFLAGADFSAGKLARAADMPASHLSDLRAGLYSPKLDTAARLVRAAMKLSGKKVTIDQLFDVDLGEVA